MNDNSIYILKVLDGIHKNAEMNIKADENYMIGSSDACDIIFFDAGVEEEHLCLYSWKRDIVIVKKSSDIFIDGQKLIETTKKIKAYQVITIGEAHFAIGPAELKWPMLAPSVIKNEPVFNFSSELVPLNLHKKSSLVVELERKLSNYLNAAKDAILQTNKKLLIGIGIFSFIFLFFWFDFIQSGINETKSSSINTSGANNKKLLNKSLLIALNTVLNNAKNNSLILIGVKEPTLNTGTENPVKIEPIQKIRESLYRKWSNSLSESIKNAKEIVYKGKNSADQTSLSIKLKKEKDGTFLTEGYTLNREQKEGLMTELGDIVRVKVLAAEDVEKMCEKIMKNKEIKDPIVTFDIDKKAVRLEGETENLNDISQTEKIINKTMPDIAIHNHINFSPGELNVAASSTSGAEYVQLNDGSKIFKGGRLKNGCIIENIRPNDVQLNCSGSKVNYKLGDKS